MNNNFEEIESLYDSEPLMNQVPIYNTPPAPTYYEQLVTNNSVDDTELLQAFIGKNYDKITTKKFNVAGFFFTTYYLLYRKMFLYSFLLFLANLLILNVLKNFLLPFAFNIIVGLLVNKVYISFANKKINKIKSSNPTKNMYELKNICAFRGGTSIGQIFLGAILQFITMIAIVILMIVLGLATAFGGLLLSEGISDIKKENITDNDDINSIFNGIISNDTSVVIADEYEIIVPSIFEASMFNDEHAYNYEYDLPSGTFSSCSFSLARVSGYSSSTNMIKQMNTYYANYNPSSVSNTNVNNISWSWFAYDDDYGKTYYYATTKDNKVYLFKYEIGEDADSSCLSYKDQVLSSIREK